MGIGTEQELRESVEGLDIAIDVPEPTPFDPGLPSLKGGKPIPEEDGFWERFRLGAELASPTYNWITGLEKTSYEPEVDPSFDVAENLDLFDNIQRGDHDYIMDAVSRSDGEYRRKQIQEERGQAQRLFAGGTLSGLGFMILPMVSDPTFWGSLMLEGVGVIGATTKADRMIRMGLLAGTTATIEMGALASQKATVDAQDVLYTGLAAMSIGGAVGGVTGKALASADEFAQVADDLTKEFAKAGMKSMDDELVTPVNRSLDEAESIFGSHDPDVTAALRAEQEAVDVATGEAEEVAGIGHGKALYANIEDLKAAGKFDPEVVVNSPTFKILSKNPIMSDFLQLFKSKAEGVQFLAMNMLENASGVGGRQVTASILKHVAERPALEQVMPVIRRSFRQYTKGNGIRMLSKKYWTTAAEDHNRILRTELEHYRNAAVRGGEYVSTQPKHIQEAVDAWRKTMGEMADLAKSSGVRGFDEIVPYDGYVPLLWNAKKIAGLGKNTKPLALALAKGYEKAGIDPDDATKIANAVISRQKLQALGIDTNPGALLSKDSRVFLREMLENNNMSKKDQDALFARIDVTVAERGKSGRARARTPIDLTESVEGVRIMDYVNNDLASIGSRYIEEISGRSAMARKGIRHDGAWRAVKNAVLQEASDKGEDVAKLSKILDSTYAQFLGQPVGEGVHRGARRLMEWAMTTMLGTVGAAQLAESGNVIAAHGIANLMRYSPQLRAYRKALRAGTADETLLGELKVHIGGMWDEHLYYRPEVRLDQSYGSNGEVFQALDNVLAGSREMIGYVSGMNHIKNIQQQFVAISQANKVVKFLQAGGNNEQLLARFADVGWDEKFLARVKKKIDDGTITFQKNGAIDRLHLEKWNAKDMETFSIGMNRHSAQLIQFPMIGETNTWQHQTIGAMLTQFRSFPLLAIEKQTARNLRHADTEAATAFMGSLGLASLIYMTKTHLTSLGRPDRDEYLEQRLSPGAIFNGGLQWAGVLGPASEFVNAGSAMGLFPSDWGSGHTGRASTGAYSFDSNVPALAVARSGMRVGSDLIKAISPFSDEKWGNSETDNAFKATVLGNTLPATLLRNTLHNIPEEE